MSNFQIHSQYHGENSLSYPEMMRWDHGGFDQLQIEDKDQGYKSKIQRKPKNYANKDHKKANQKNNPKWLQNKQEMNDTKNQGWGGDRFYGPKKDWKMQKNNKPDRQIYSVRDKMATSQNKDGRDRKYQDQQKTINSSVKVQELNTVGFENNASFVSTVSTTISERVKSLDDNRTLSTANDCSLFESSLNIAMHGESKVLFAINFNSQENYETIFVYEDEDDYETFLNGVCQRHSITAEFALALKINLVKMIVDVHSNPSQVEPILNRLLEENFKTILSQS